MAFPADPVTMENQSPWEDNDDINWHCCIDVNFSATLNLHPAVRFEDYQFEIFKGEAPMPCERFRIEARSNVVQLTLEHASRSDTGHYSLNAKRHSNENESNRIFKRRVYMTVDEPSFFEEGDPPLFLRRLSDLTVKVGTRTRFLVEIRSTSETKVTWHRNDEPIKPGSRFSFVHEGNFFCVDVAPVTVEDQGHWTCMVENRSGRSSCTSHLNIIVPKAYKRPQFASELRAILTEFGSVSLECKVIGVPTPVLRWFKDNKEIKAGDVFALSANPDDPTSLGTYTCQAINCMGIACSSSRVHVVGKGSREGSLKPADPLIVNGDPPIFKRTLKDDCCRIGDSLYLACQVQVPPWPKEIAWYNKEGHVKSSDRYKIMEDGLGGYSIQIQPVEAADEGEWKCVATSYENIKQFSTCYVAMSIPRNYRKPRFMESLTAILTEEGLVSFECKVVGFPTPLLRWFKDGKELKPGDVYQLTGTNSLGTYCCVARNCMGEATSTAELTLEDIQNQLNDEERLQLLTINQPPKFIKGLKSCEVKICSDFKFTVQVSVMPVPSLSWFRDDHLIENEDRYKIETENTGVVHLNILKLEFCDQAEWKCVASNDFGHSVTSCFLKLIIPRHYRKPKFLENLRAILSEGGAVNLECKVIGVPQPALKWYKDGEELKPGDIHKIISGQDGTCSLGTYTCEATNCMGTVSSSASLLGYEDCISPHQSGSAISAKVENELELARNLSLSTINEERTSQLLETALTDQSSTERGEVSFTFDGKDVSVSLYETPDLTEEEAFQIIEMYADQLSEHISEHNVVELPPMRFVKETSTSGNLYMEAVVIDVSPDYFASIEENYDQRTEADLEEISTIDVTTFSSPMSGSFDDEGAPVRPPRRNSEAITSKVQEHTESYHSAPERAVSLNLPDNDLNTEADINAETLMDALSRAQPYDSGSRKKDHSRKRSNSGDSFSGATNLHLDPTSCPVKKKKEEMVFQIEKEKRFGQECGFEEPNLTFVDEIPVEDVMHQGLSIHSEKEKISLKSDEKQFIELLRKIAEPVLVVRKALIDSDFIFENEQLIDSFVTENVLIPIQNLYDTVTDVESKALNNTEEKSFIRDISISILEIIGGPAEELLRAFELIHQENSDGSIRINLSILESLVDPVDEILFGLAKLEFDLCARSISVNPIVLDRIIRTTSRYRDTVQKNNVNMNETMMAALQKIHSALSTYLNKISVNQFGIWTENIDAVLVESLARPLEDLQRASECILFNNSIDSMEKMLEIFNEILSRLEALVVALEGYEGDYRVSFVVDLKKSVVIAAEVLSEMKNEKMRYLSSLPELILDNLVDTQACVNAVIIDLETSHAQSSSKLISNLAELREYLAFAVHKTTTLKADDMIVALGNLEKPLNNLQLFLTNTSESAELTSIQNIIQPLITLQSIFSTLLRNIETQEGDNEISSKLQPVNEIIEDLKKKILLITDEHNIINYKNESKFAEEYEIKSTVPKILYEMQFSSQLGTVHYEIASILEKYEKLKQADTSLVLHNLNDLRASIGNAATSIDATISSFKLNIDGLIRELLKLEVPLKNLNGALTNKKYLTVQTDVLVELQQPIERLKSIIQNFVQHIDQESVMSSVIESIVDIQQNLSVFTDSNFSLVENQNYDTTDFVNVAKLKDVMTEEDSSKELVESYNIKNLDNENDEFLEKNAIYPEDIFVAKMAQSLNEIQQNLLEILDKFDQDLVLVNLPIASRLAEALDGLRKAILIVRSNLSKVALEFVDVKSESSHSDTQQNTERISLSLQELLYPILEVRDALTQTQQFKAPEMVILKQLDQPIKAIESNVLLLALEAQSRVINSDKSSSRASLDTIARVLEDIESQIPITLNELNYREKILSTLYDNLKPLEIIKDRISEILNDSSNGDNIEFDVADILIKPVDSLQFILHDFFNLVDAGKALSSNDKNIIISLNGLVEPFIELQSALSVVRSSKRTSMVEPALQDEKKNVILKAVKELRLGIANIHLNVKREENDSVADATSILASLDDLDSALQLVQNRISETNYVRRRSCLRSLQERVSQPLKQLEQKIIELEKELDHQILNLLSESLETLLKQIQSVQEQFFDSSSQVTDEEAIIEGFLYPTQRLLTSLENVEQNKILSGVKNHNMFLNNLAHCIAHFSNTLLTLKNELVQEGGSENISVIETLTAVLTPASKIEKVIHKITKPTEGEEQDLEDSISSLQTVGIRSGEQISTILTTVETIVDEFIEVSKRETESLTMMKVAAEDNIDYEYNSGILPLELSSDYGEFGKNLEDIETFLPNFRANESSAMSTVQSDSGISEGIDNSSMHVIGSTPSFIEEKQNSITALWSLIKEPLSKLQECISIITNVPYTLESVDDKNEEAMYEKNILSSRLQNLKESILVMERIAKEETEHKASSFWQENSLLVLQNLASSLEELGERLPIMVSKSQITFEDSTENEMHQSMSVLEALKTLIAPLHDLKQRLGLIIEEQIQEPSQIAIKSEVNDVECAKGETKNKKSEKKNYYNEEQINEKLSQVDYFSPSNNSNQKHGDCKTTEHIKTEFENNEFEENKKMKNELWNGPVKTDGISKFFTQHEKTSMEEKEEQRQHEETERLKQEREVRIQQEKGERSIQEKEKKVQQQVAEHLKHKEEDKLQQEEAKRLKREEEEKLEQEDTERLKQEKKEKLKKEEAERIKQLEEEKLEYEEDERIKQLEERKLKQKEADRLKQEQEEKIKQEKAEHLKQLEEEKLEQEETERLERAEEDKLKQEEAERIKQLDEEKLEQEEAERLKQEQEEKLKQEEADRLKQEKEEKCMQEEADRLNREQEEKLKREESERLKFEKEEKRKQEEADCLKQEQEKKLKQEESERLKQEQEEKLKQEEAERLKREEEEKSKQEEADRLKQEQEKKLKQEESERLKQEQEEKLKQEEAERLKREEEEKRKQEEAERLKQAQEKKLMQEEADCLKQEKEEKCMQEEADRLNREQEEKRQQEEAKRMQQEQEEKLKQEEAERLKREEEEKSKQEEADRLKKEQEEKLKQEEAERLKQEQEEKLKQEEAERLKREEEEKRKQEEAERLKQEQEEKLKQEEAERSKREEEEKSKQEEADRLKQEQEEKLKQEESGRLKQEQEEKLKQEEAERLIQEQEEKLKQEEAERSKREEEEKSKQEEADRLKQEQEEKLKQEESERLKQEQEEKLKQEESERLKQEQEEKLKQEESGRLKQEQEEKLKQEEAERLIQEQEEKLKQEEAERSKREEEEKSKQEEADRLKQEQEEKLKQEESERLKQEQEEKLKQEESERLKKEQEEKLKQEEAERSKREEVEKRKQEEAERLKREEEEKLKQEEAERLKQEQEEKLKQEEADRLKQEKEEKCMQEEADRLNREQEEKLKREESVRLKLEKEEKRKQEESERFKQEQEEKLKQEEAESSKREEEEKRKQEEAKRLKQAQEKKLKQEEAERLKQAQEEKLKQEEADRLKREEEEKLKQEEAERLKQEQEKKLKQEEAERSKREEVEKRKQEEADRLNREQEEKRQQEEAKRLQQEQEENLKREESERLKLEKEEKRKQEEAERFKQEQEKKLKQEEVERLEKEQEEKLKQEEAKRLKQEQEEKLKQEEAERSKREEVEKRKQEEAERLKQEQEEKLKQEEAERLKREEEEKRKQEESERLKLEKEEKRKQEEAERFKQEQEEKLKQEEVERLKQEQEEKLKQEESERLKKEQEEKLKQEESERLKLEKEEKRKQEEAERFKQEQEEKLKQEEVERLKQEQEEKLKQEEAERLKREEEEKRKQEEADRLKLEKDEKRKQEEAERLKQAQEEKLKQEEAERLKREEEEKRKQEEADRLKQEQEKKLKQEESERLKQEQEEKLKQEEAERLKQEQEEKLKHEEAERSKQEQEEKLKQEESERLKKEQEEKLKQEESERLKLEKEEKRKQEEAERFKQEQEEKLKQEEVERLKQEQEEKLKQEEAERLKQEEVEKLKREESERLKLEKEEKRKQEEAERLKQAQEEKLKQEEAERLKREEEEKRKQEEAERLKREEEEKRKQEEADRLKQEQEKKLKQEESERLKQEQEEKLKQEEAERLKQEQEEKLKHEEAERSKREEEDKRKQEEAERLKPEQEEKLKQEEAACLKKEEEEQRKQEEADRVKLEQEEKLKQERVDRLKAEEEEIVQFKECEPVKSFKEQLDEIKDSQGKQDQYEVNASEKNEEFNQNSDIDVIRNTTTTENSKVSQIQQQKKIDDDKNHESKKALISNLELEYITESNLVNFMEEKFNSADIISLKKNEISETSIIFLLEPLNNMRRTIFDMLRSFDTSKCINNVSKNSEKNSLFRDCLSDLHYAISDIVDSDISSNNEEVNLTKLHNLIKAIEHFSSFFPSHVIGTNESLNDSKDDDKSDQKVFLNVSSALMKPLQDLRDHLEYILIDDNMLISDLEKSNVDLTESATSDELKNEVKNDVDNKKSGRIEVDKENKILKAQEKKCLNRNKNKSEIRELNDESEECSNQNKIRKKSLDKKNDCINQSKKFLHNQKTITSDSSVQLQKLQISEKLKSKTDVSSINSFLESDAEILKQNSLSQNNKVIDNLTLESIKDSTVKRFPRELKTSSSCYDFTVGTKSKNRFISKSRDDLLNLRYNDALLPSPFSVSSIPDLYLTGESYNIKLMPGRVSSSTYYLNQRSNLKSMSSKMFGSAIMNFDRPSYTTKFIASNDYSLSVADSLALSRSRRRFESRNAAIVYNEKSEWESSLNNKLSDRGRCPSFCTQLTNSTVAEGSRLRLICTTIGMPEPEVYWTKNGDRIRLGGREKMKYENGIATLEILPAELEDAGYYTCVAKNRKGQAFTEATVKIYSIYHTFSTETSSKHFLKEKLNRSCVNSSLEYGSRVRSTPLLPYLHDCETFRSDVYNQTSNQMHRLNSFTAISNQCRSRSTAHKIYDKSYNVDTKLPQVSSALTDHKVPAGGTIALQVEIKDRLVPNVTWLRSNGERKEIISSPKAKTFVESNVYTLVVPEATESEAGTYVCRVSNAFGHIDTSATIEIISSNKIDDFGKPAMFVSRPLEKLMQVLEGESVSVSFRMSGTPKPRVTWMKGLKDITDGPRSHKDMIDDYVRLCLSRVTLEDEGTYCILVKNCYGCDRFFFTLKLKLRARSLTPTAEKLSLSDHLSDIHTKEIQSYLKNVPGPISSGPIVIDGGRNWLSLTWGKTIQRGPAPVIAYRVDAWQLGEEGGARWIELGVTPINSFDAFNLRPGGEYKFRVTPRNRYGWGESVTMIGSATVCDNIAIPEFTNILPAQLKALMGSTVQLKCEVRSDSKYIVKWFHETIEIDSSLDNRYTVQNESNKCSLTLKNISEMDSGRYICEVSNKAGRVSSYGRILVVSDQKILNADVFLKKRFKDGFTEYGPPQFTMRLRDRRVQTSYPVRLTCQVYGSPEPEVIWSKNGQKILLTPLHSIYKDESHFHTLEIARSNSDDSGTYSACARNINGSVSCHCELVVDKGIRAYIAPQFSYGLNEAYAVKIGGELRLTAQVEAYPSVGIVWHRDGVRLRPRRTSIMKLTHDGTVELILTKVTSRDAGVYTCTATNEVGKVETQSRVSILDPDDDASSNVNDAKTHVIINPPENDTPYSKKPKFLTKPLSIESEEGETVVIQCEVVGDPKPDVMWLRDFLKPEYYRDAPHFRCIGVGPQYLLEIPHAKFEYTGTYSVLAKNKHGEAKAVISLQIYAKGQGKCTTMDKNRVKTGDVISVPKIKRPLTDIRCCDGDAVTLDCSIHVLTELPSVRWEKYGKAIILDNDFSTHFDGESAKLIIKHVYPEDEGEYTCIFSNELGNAMTSACLIVDVPEGKENILSRTLALTPRGFRSVNSTPMSTPRSTPVRSLSPMSKSRNLKPLVLPRAVDRMNLTKRKPKICPPKFYSIPHNRVVEEGETVRFQCAVSGHPLPWCAWDKDGQPLTNSSRVAIKEKDDIHTIEISGVNFEDAGLYRVTLENDVGKTEATARLEIINRNTSVSQRIRTRSASPRTRPTFSKSLLNTTSRINGQMQLQCNIQGVPSPNVSWFRNGKRIECTKRIKKLFVEGKAKLLISGIKHIDAGEYVCEANNFLGSIRSSCKVKVLDKDDISKKDCSSPKFAQTLLNESMVMENDSYELQTRVSGTPPFMIKWLKNGCEVLDNDCHQHIIYEDGSIALRFLNVHLSDAGEYTCIVKNQYGETFCRGLLIVQDSNNKSSDLRFYFTKKPVLRCVAKGETASFCARIQSQYSVDIDWTINGRSMQNDHRCVIERDGSTSIFRIYDVTHRDCGEIRCIASINKGFCISASTQLHLTPSNLHDNSFKRSRERFSSLTRSTQSSELKKIVLSMPHLNIQKNNMDSQSRASSLERKSKNNTSSCPRFKKIWNAEKGLFGQTIKRSTSISPVRDKNISNQSLRSLSVNRKNRNSMKESLEINDKNEEITSSKITSNLKRLYTPIIIPKTRHILTKLSKKRKEKSVNEIIQNTEKKIENIQASGELSASNIHYNTNENFINNLSLHKLNNTDNLIKLSSKKYYNFKKTNEEKKLFSEVRNSKITRLKKHKKIKSSSAVPAIILIAPEDTVSMIGSTVTLEIRYQGWPEPTVKWTRAGQELANDEKTLVRTTAGISRLILINITADQAGKYAVAIENKCGSDFRFTSVAVEGPPYPPSKAPVVTLLPRRELGVTISWGSPIYDGGCALTGYTVECRCIGQLHWQIIAENCHRLNHNTTALKPGASYIFRVRALNVHGPSQPSPESEFFKLPYFDMAEIEDKLCVEDDFESAKDVHLEDDEFFTQRYILHEELGKGRFGIVRRVVDKRNDKSYAAKIVKVIKARDRQQVKDEMKIMNILRHPKLLRLTAAFESQREIIMVTEYISGGELFERVVADDFTLTEKDSIIFMRQICDGVRYMHENNIVHLDLKPENIMCHTRTSHRIKLIDFGLAQIIKPGEDTRVHLGTPEFIPPEIINYDPIGLESDMWSVGVICYVLLSGLSPFMGDNNHETFANIVRADYDFDDEAFDAISEDAKDFISNLLQKKKELRMSAQTCLNHSWLAQHTENMSSIALPTDKLKKFIIRRKWQKTTNAIVAVGRMTNLTANRRSPSQSLTSSKPISVEIPRSDSADLNQHVNVNKSINFDSITTAIADESIETKLRVLKVKEIDTYHKDKVELLKERNVLREEVSNNDVKCLNVNHQIISSQNLSNNKNVREVTNLKKEDPVLFDSITSHNNDFSKRNFAKEASKVDSIINSRLFDKTNDSNHYDVQSEKKKEEYSSEDKNFIETNKCSLKNNKDTENKKSSVKLGMKSNYSVVENPLKRPSLHKITTKFEVIANSEVSRMNNSPSTYSRRFIPTGNVSRTAKMFEQLDSDHSENAKTSLNTSSMTENKMCSNRIQEAFAFWKK